ncbi:hypothetical protein D3C81_1049460 [compost metagenome]
MGRALEVPLDGAVVRVERQARRGVEVVARAQVRVPRRRVAGTEQQQVGFGVVVTAKPRGRATGFPEIARPGLARLAAGDAVFHRFAVLVDVAHMAFDRWPGPQQITVFRVVGLDLAHHAKLATGHAGNQLAVDHQRRGADRVAFLVVGDFLAPHHLAGVLVQRHELGVEGAEDHQVAIQRDATVDHVAARADVIGQARIVLPEFLAGARIHGEDPGVGTGHVHHAVLDHRLRLLATLFFTAEGKRPRRAQLLDVVDVENIQRAVALPLNAEAVGHDLFRVLRILENVLVGNPGQCLAGQQHGTEQQAQDEGLATCGLGHDGFLCGFLLCPENFPGLVQILGRRCPGNNCPQCGVF